MPWLWIGVYLLKWFGKKEPGEALAAAGFGCRRLVGHRYDVVFGGCRYSASGTRLNCLIFSNVSRPATNAISPRFVARLLGSRELVIAPLQEVRAKSAVANLHQSPSCYGSVLTHGSAIPYPASLTDGLFSSQCRHQERSVVWTLEPVMRNQACPKDGSFANPRLCRHRSSV